MPAPKESAGGRENGRYEIRLSGSGGQGIILAATVLADALIASGREVLQTQSYGPEARGGASKAEVIVSEAEIDYPEVTDPDVTLCLSQEAFERDAAQTTAGGIVLFDSDLVTAAPLQDVRLLGLPFSARAEGELGKVVAANIVALGALLKVTGLVPAEQVREVLKRRLPERFLELDLRALDLGLAAQTGAPARA